MPVSPQMAPPMMGLKKRGTLAIWLKDGESVFPLNRSSACFSF